jgi:hypothetical protein
MKRILSALTFSVAVALAASCGSDPQETLALDQSGVVACAGSDNSATGAGGSSSGAGGAQVGSGGSGPSIRDARADEPFVPGPPYMAPAHTGNLIHVKNGCSFPLWIHGVGGGAILMPDDFKLNAGDAHDYTVGDWPFAWVTAYLDGPQMNMIARAELNLFPAGLLSYRLGYIDGIALPMELQGIGPGADCKRVGCYVPQARIVAECPDGLLSGKRCSSPGSYCQDAANASKPYCHALDAAIAKCAASVAGCQDTAGATTGNVYRCDKAFGDKPNLCAALNRGMVDDPTNTNLGSYYAKPPYNSFAAWLHDICPGLTAFPYDDAQTSEDSYHLCQGPANNSTQLNITFCPAG